VRLKKKINRWFKQGMVGTVNAADIELYGIGNEILIPKRLEVQFPKLKEPGYIYNGDLELV